MVGLRDKITEYAEEELTRRMGPAVEQMKRLEHEMKKLRASIDRLEKTIREKK